MENQSHLKGSNMTKSLNSFILKEQKQNLIKKRPSTTKLQLEKIFQQSIELTEVFKKLSYENCQLKLEHQKVQSNKSSRQALISMVENIVKEKAKELNKNPTNQSSWLVHKLNSKVYELKSKIEAKQKAIRQVQMSKEKECIRQQQCQIKCLNEVIQHLKSKKLENNKIKPTYNYEGCKKDFEQFEETLQHEDCKALNDIKEIVWLQEQIREKEADIIDAQKIYEQQQRQVRKIMIQISKKKSQLIEIKELQQQFYRAQQEFKEQKKKKEQRLAGNKTYLDQLVQSKNNELKKLELLKEKYNIIEVQETQNIQLLKKNLEQLKFQYEKKNKARLQLVLDTVEEPVQLSKEKWVKRVAFKDIKNIAKNLNYQIALKRIPKQVIFKEIFKSQDQKLSIREVIRILQQFPFDIQNYQQRQLLARYCIEDAGQGYFKEDMQTSQIVPIIKSVLSKLIGDVRIYSEVEENQLLKKIGDLMLRFCSLIQQNLEVKQGSIKYATKEMIETAILATSLDLNQDEINFIILYLFSWKHNVDELQICHLKEMLDKGVRWIVIQHKDDILTKIN